CGRLALPLAEKIANATYVGVDILPALIAFSRREITKLYPNFKFYTVREDNPQFEQYMQTAGDDLVAGDLEALNSSFDVVVALSVFTHLAHAEAQEMLKTVWRRLAPGGTALLTFFVLDPMSRAQIRNRQANRFRDVTDVDQPTIVEGNAA